MAVSALWGHKLRAFLTVLGVAIGIFTVGTVTAIIDGLNKSFSDQISMLGSDVFYVSRANWFGGYEEWIKSWRRKPITMDTAEFLEESCTLVSAATPVLQRNSTIKFKDRSLEFIETSGVNDRMPEIEGSDIAEGRFFTQSETRHRKDVAVIGEEIRKEFFPLINPIDQTIKIDGHRFTVIGLFTKKGEMLGHNMDNRIQIPYLSFVKYFGGKHRDVTIAVKSKYPDRGDETLEEITAVMRNQRGLRPQDEDDFAVNQISALLDLYKSMTAMLWAVAIGIGSISLIVGGIGVMNIMLVTVAERTREIGIRKSIGATRRKILFQFLVESMVVCAVGVLLGLLAASGAAFMIEKFTPLAARIPANWAFIGVGTVVLVGLIFGLWPANKAASLDPIEALHYS